MAEKSDIPRASASFRSIPPMVRITGGPEVDSAPPKACSHHPLWLPPTASPLPAPIHTRSSTPRDIDTCSMTPRPTGCTTPPWAPQTSPPLMDPTLEAVRHCPLRRAARRGFPSSLPPVRHWRVLQLYPWQTFHPQ